MIRHVTVPVARGVELHADIGEPDGPVIGSVVFAHGSGSSRHSPRNMHVAELLRGVGMRTVLLDLLTEAEERVDVYTREHRFDIPLLARRLVGVIDWMEGEEELRVDPIGLFGASTGAAAALAAAAARPDEVGAVVSRGGRPDLAGESLGRVQAPTLLIVGSRDHTVIDLNRRARARLTAPTALEIVEGATHLFEEPGTLDQVARLAGDWFVAHLSG
jgi:putative phosphoribosyl transferase